MRDRVLVVVAHPDDEVLGCGGTIARLSRDHEIRIAILGEGATSRFESRDAADPSLVPSLERDARECARRLGVLEVLFGGLPDNRFDERPLLEVVKIVEDLVRDFRPATIYTHHPGDLNIDHGVVFRAVLTATRPISGGSVREILACEVPSSTELAFGRIEPAFRPNVFADVSETISRKIEAMEAYGGESRPWPHPRSGEALRVLARRWGASVGLEYAEAFELVRSLR